MSSSEVTFLNTGLNLNCEEYMPRVPLDIKNSLLYRKNKMDIYCIGSIEKDRYIQVKDSNVKDVMFFIALMDGKHTISDIQSELDKAKIKMSANDFVKKLIRAGLVEDVKVSKSFNEIKLLSIKVASIDIKNTCKFLQPIAGYIIAICMILALLSSVLLTAVILKGNFNFDSYLKYKQSYFQGMIISSLLIIPTFLIHEFSHMIVALKYKLMPSHLNFVLYFGFIPMFFVTIPGIYTVQRYKRILILFAGIFINLVLTSLVIGISGWYSNNYLRCFASANWQIAIANLTPFALCDGYFILTNILKVTNLRKDFLKRIASFGSKRNKMAFSITSMLYFSSSMLFLAFMGMYEGYWILKTVEGVLNYKGIFISNQNFMVIIVSEVFILLVAFILVIHRRFKNLVD